MVDHFHVCLHKKVGFGDPTCFPVYVAYKSHLQAVSPLELIHQITVGKHERVKGSEIWKAE